MVKEILDYINSVYQNMKIEMNINVSNMDTGVINVEKMEIKMMNLEYEYSILRRKKFYTVLSHYLLSILTFGIYNKLSKESYKLNIDEIEYEIVNIIFDTRDLKKLIQENNNILKNASEKYEKNKVLFDNLRMFLNLMEDLDEVEINKYLSYKIGD